MKKKPTLFILISIIIILSSCSSVKVISDFDGEASFDKYKTYGFKLPVSSDEEYPAIVNPLNQRRIENAISEEMILRGYKESLTPDIYISYFVKVDEKTQTRVNDYYANPYGSSYYGYYYGYHSSYRSVSTVDYKEGTMLIDLVDSESNSLIWYGSGTKSLSQRSNNQEENINRAVTKIFTHYPFMAGKKEPVRSTNPKR